MWKHIIKNIRNVLILKKETEVIKKNNIDIRTIFKQRDD